MLGKKMENFTWRERVWVKLTEVSLTLQMIFLVVWTSCYSILQQLLFLKLVPDSKETLTSHDSKDHMESWNKTGVWCVWLFPRLRGFGENVRQFIPRLRFTFFFFQVEISLRKIIPLFRPWSVHSGSGSWDDCDRMFPDKLRVSSFPDRFLHSTWTAA